MFIGEFGRTFAVVFSAELPDKTMFTTLVLVTRFRRPLVVWSGVATAFLIHATIAVTAGRLISLLPDRPVKFAVSGLFAVGAVVLWRTAENNDELVPAVDDTIVTTRRVWVTSFGLLLLAEWGDLTQLSMASLAARSSAPLAVFVGGLIALWAVAGIAATAGGELVKRGSIMQIRRVAAVVFAGLAIFTVIEAIRA